MESGRDERGGEFVGGVLFRFGGHGAEGEEAGEEDREAGEGEEG